MKIRWPAVAILSTILATTVPAVLGPDVDSDPLPDAADTPTEATAGEEEHTPQIESDAREPEQPSASTPAQFNRSERPRSWDQTPGANERSRTPSPANTRTRTGTRPSARTFNRRDQQARPPDGQRTSRTPPTTGAERSSTNAVRETSDAGQNYAPFRIIAERNIFNPNRSSRTSRVDRESRPRSAPEVITLVGTLSYEKGSYAFFEGSKVELRKVVAVGQGIADYRVVAIGTDTVTMQWKTNTFQLEIGGQLRRRENGWEAIRGVVALARATNAESRSASGGDESDVIKRLMQQREKELNNAE